MKLSVDQDDVFCVTYGQEMQFSSKFHVIVPAFWWLMMCPPITKVSETSLPSFSADALMHDHWKGSRLSHNLDWSLAQQHISVQFTSIHSFAGINDAHNKNMELFFQCFSPFTTKFGTCHGFISYVEIIVSLFAPSGPMIVSSSSKHWTFFAINGKLSNQSSRLDPGDPKMDPGSFLVSTVFALLRLEYHDCDGDDILDPYCVAADKLSFGYISTSANLVKKYSEGFGDFCGSHLPDKLRESSWITK